MAFDVASGAAQRSAGGRERARELVAATIGADDRVLLTGATGWFGKTALRLLPNHLRANALLIAGASGEAKVPVEGSQYLAARWSESAIQTFAPTVVLNFAFMTKGRWASLGTRTYETINSRLTNRLTWAAALDSVRIALTVSSGAAVDQLEDPNPYGRLKAHEERVFLESIRNDGGRIVLRAWSVSGGLVRDPEGYLFSSLVSQALRGVVRVKSQVPVWRRYSLADDVLAVAIALAGQGERGVLDTGGPLIESHDLASLVCARLGADLVTAPRTDAVGDVYHSDGRSWDSACAHLGYPPADLLEQIELTAADLVHESKSRLDYQRGSE